MVHGIVEAYASPDDRLYASIEVILSNMLFWGATYFIKSLKMPKITGTKPSNTADS